MSAPASRFRASADVIAGALVAELVVYLGVLLADASAGGQPAPADHLDGSDAAAGAAGLRRRRTAQMRSASTGVLFPRRR